MIILHKYYFKIQKGETALEFATDDLCDFDTKVSEWVDNICSEIPVEGSTTNETQRRDFIELKELVKINEITKPQEEPENQKEINFEEVLEESIKNPKLDLDKHIAEQTEFERMLDDKAPKNQIDILVVTCFHMIHFENMLRFSIKQMNSRLVPIKKEPITHKIVQEAIEHGLIELVPDLTGLGDVNEYTLTQRGEEYYFNELK